MKHYRRESGSRVDYAHLEVDRPDPVLGKFDVVTLHAVKDGEKAITAYCGDGHRLLTTLGFEVSE